MAIAERICSLVDGGRPLAFEMIEGSKGDARVVPVTDGHFNRNGQMQNDGSLQALPNGSNAPLGEIKLAHLQTFEKFLMSYSTSPSTYKYVKKNEDWRKVYRYANRAVPYLDKNTGDAAPRPPEMTTFCDACEVLLPEWLVSVDHMRPQKGGQLDAVYKVFKAMGYAQQQPAGAKGKLVLLNFVQGVGGSQGPFSGKYALNIQGAIVFSLFKSCGYESNLQDMSMHNFLNLRPVCPRCNSSLGNKL